MILIPFWIANIIAGWIGYKNEFYSKPENGGFIFVIYQSGFTVVLLLATLAEIFGWKIK